MSDNLDIKVSVLCIVFNHRKYIRRCLDSMINQKTDFQYEIIIHDDASTDGTQLIIKEYAAKYPDLIKPILQDKNQYSNGNDIMANYLFPAASGKYCVEIEGDDFWCDENKLQLQVDALEKHPQCSLCVHATNTVDTEGNPLAIRFPMMKLNQSCISVSEFMEMNLDPKSWPFHLSAFMVSSALFKEYMDFKRTGYPSKFYRVGDLPLYLYFGLKGYTYYIDRYMSTYTMESGGFMSRVKRDPQFAYQVHKGFIDGLTEFDKFTHYQYTDKVRRMIAMRRFEIARLDRRFDLIVTTPELRPYIKTRGIIKQAAFYVVGYSMFFARIFRKGKT